MTAIDAAYPGRHTAARAAATITAILHTPAIWPLDARTYQRLLQTAGLDPTDLHTRPSALALTAFLAGTGWAPITADSTPHPVFLTDQLTRHPAYRHGRRALLSGHLDRHLHERSRRNEQLRSGRGPPPDRRCDVTTVLFTVRL